MNKTVKSSKNKAALAPAFLIPALLCGALAGNWWYQLGMKDQDRWSHLTGAMSQAGQQELLTFSIVIGLVAGLFGGIVSTLIRYMITRSRSH
ncbi:MAG TPA: hypothetical protein V6C86_24600 [Oculatellaceae cyanobacterium]